MFNLMPEDDADQLAEVSFLKKLDYRLLNDDLFPCQKLVLIKDTIHGRATVSSRRYFTEVVPNDFLFLVARRGS